jgi:hypothetical protein
MLESLGRIYGESPEIMSLLEHSLSIHGSSQESFDIDTIEALITAHNSEHPNLPLPSLQAGNISSLLVGITALRSVNLAVKFDESISQIMSLQEEMNEIQISLEASRQELIRLQEVGNQEEIDAAKQASLNAQYMSY